MGHAEIVELQIQPLRSALAADGCESLAQPRLAADIRDLHGTERSTLSIALLDEQVYSKLWLLEQLFTLEPFDRATILVLGGWCGVLPWLAHLTGRGAAATWVSVDFDPTAGAIGRRVFGGVVPNLSFECRNIYDLDYKRLAQEQPLVVINTICEHLANFGTWRSMLPEGVTTVLQSNNYRGCPDHINCIDTIEELVAAADCKELLFAGALPVTLFTRFMVIGRI
jgi:hypothetical protein